MLRICTGSADHRQPAERALALPDRLGAKHIDELGRISVGRVQIELLASLRRTRRWRRHPCRRARWRARRSCGARFRDRASSSPPVRLRRAPSARRPIASIGSVRASSSLNSRTFSIAITAWAAKVLSNSTCLAGNGPGSRAADGDGADRTCPRASAERPGRCGSRRRAMRAADRIVGLLVARPEYATTPRSQDGPGDRACRGRAVAGNSARISSPYCGFTFTNDASWISSPSKVNTFAELALAQFHRGRRDRVEYRLHIRLRLADHAQDVARRRLLFERFREVAIARARAP